MFFFESPLGLAPGHHLFYVFGAPWAWPLAINSFTGYEPPSLGKLHSVLLPVLEPPRGWPLAISFSNSYELPELGPWPSISLHV